MMRANSPPPSPAVLTSLAPLSASPAATSLRRLGILAVLVMLVAAWQLSGIQGIWRPVRIVGGSMAESLRGDHFVVTCLECQFVFPCDVEHLADDRLAVCPNCGSPDNSVRDQRPRRGDRVLIDRTESANSPRRWDVVALVSADDSSQLEVKRVVGLPGEQVELLGGDVWVNGQPATKSLEQFRRLAIRVHDDRFRPADPSLPDRWSGERADQGWHATEQGYSHSAASHESSASQNAAGMQQPGRTSDGWHWLGYRQWPCMKSPFPPRGRTEHGAIWDHYGYNQALSRGSLNPVDDLRLSLRIRASSGGDVSGGKMGGGEVGLRMNVAGHLYEVRWSPQGGSVRLLLDGRPVRSARAPRIGIGRPVRVELAHWDAQVGLTMDGQLILRYAIPASELREPVADLASGPEPATGPERLADTNGLAATPTMLQVGVTSDMTAQVDQLCVDRDVHYLHPFGTGQPWSPPRRLGPDEYLVLGDNVPVSRDSRHWPNPFVRRRAILGKVLSFRPSS